MPKLVIVSRRPHLEVGRVYRSLESGPFSEPEPNQCFLVVARSTESAWIECLESFGQSRDHLEMIAVVNGPWYYYEIETD